MPEAILAAGFVYRRAVETPSKFVVLFFLWIQFLPVVMLNALTIAIVLHLGSDGLSTTATFWLAVLWASLCGGALFRSTRNYFALKQN